MMSRDGFVAVSDLLSSEELLAYQSLYSAFLSGAIDAGRHRHDLGSHEAQKTAEENVCQIMWPSEYVDILHVNHQ